jgi:hypothetical protein
MTKARTMLSLAADYLSERRALGFDLRIAGNQIVAFARFVDDRSDNGPLTNEIVLNWVQGEAKRASPMSWARRLDVLARSRGIWRGSTPLPSFLRPQSLAAHTAASRRTSILSGRSAIFLPPPGTLRPRADCGRPHTRRSSG